MNFTKIRHSQIFTPLLILAIPVIGSIFANYLVMHLTGRDLISQPDYPDFVPLNLRLKGYDLMAAIEYWTWLKRNNGMIAEQRLLKADLLYPFAYGGAMLISFLLAWKSLERPFRRRWFLVPLAGAVFADWTENLLHLQQLRNFVSNEPIHANLIHVASLATTLKLTFLAVSALLIYSLCVCVIYHNREHRRELMQNT